MGRSEERAEARRMQKYVKKFDKRTKNLSKEEKEKLISNIGKNKVNVEDQIFNMLENCYYKAMRENRISEERAHRIMQRTMELIAEQD